MEAEAVAEAPEAVLFYGSRSGSGGKTKLMEAEAEAEAEVEAVTISSRKARWKHLPLATSFYG